jgi:hypothetical protein
MKLWNDIQSSLDKKYKRVLFNIFVACAIGCIILSIFYINYALKAYREYDSIRLLCHQNYADYVIPKDNNMHTSEYDLDRIRNVNDLARRNYNRINAEETNNIEKSRKFSDCMDNSYYGFAKGSAFDYLTAFGVLASIAALIAVVIFFDFFQVLFRGSFARIKFGRSRQD